MNAGKLRKLITLQQQSATNNEFGEQIITWSRLGIDKWAKKEPLRGKEYFAGQQFNSKIDTKFTLRYVTEFAFQQDAFQQNAFQHIEINPKMRLVCDLLPYNIESIINVGERNRELQIMCSRVAT